MILRLMYILRPTDGFAPKRAMFDAAADLAAGHAWVEGYHPIISQSRGASDFGEVCERMLFLFDVEMISRSAAVCFIDDFSPDWSMCPRMEALVRFAKKQRKAIFRYATPPEFIQAWPPSGESGAEVLEWLKYLEGKA